MVPGPGRVNGMGFLGHITKAVGKDKLLFPEVPFSHRRKETEDLGLRMPLC